IDAKASLLQRLEYATAVTRMLSVNEMMAYAAAQPGDEHPDWGWRALAFPPTVDAGHTFVKMTFAETLVEAASVLGVPPDGGAQTLWPFVRQLRSDTAEAHAAAMARVMPVVCTRPQEVPYLAWYEAERHVPSGSTPVEMTAMVAWYSRTFPTGTSFQARRLLG